MFSFTVLAVEVPGSIPESQSSTSLYDLWLRVEQPQEGSERFDVTVHDHPADTIQTLSAKYRPGGPGERANVLEVFGVSDFVPGPVRMTISVDGADAGTDPNVDPFVLEGLMEFNAAEDRYEFIFETLVNLKRRRMVISTDEGGSYNDVIQ